MTAKSINLHDYQHALVDFSLRQPRAMWILGVGGGKTVTALVTSVLKSQRGDDVGNVLVVAPLNIVKSTWIDEIEEWGFDVRFESLVVNDRGKKLTRAKRLEKYESIFQTPPTFYTLNKELLPDLVSNMPLDNHGNIQWPFNTLIIDEYQMFSFDKNPTVGFEALAKIAPLTENVIGMTGTPMAKSGGLLNMWSLNYVLDGGKALGDNFYDFRNTLFMPTKFINNRPVKYEPVPGAEDYILSRIQNNMISVQGHTHEPIVDDFRISLDADSLEMYEELKKEAIVSFIAPIIAMEEAQSDAGVDNEQLTNANDEDGSLTIEAKNAGALRIKLLQIASGSMYVDRSKNYVEVHDKKLEACDYIVQNADGPTLIAYRFVSEKDRLMKWFNAKGQPGAEVFDGSRDMVQRWNNGDIPVMLLQPASAGHGINLQKGPGHTLIWHTLPDSLELYTQANGRLARQGQKNTVYVHRLLTRNTVDVYQPGRLEKRSDDQQRMIDAVMHDIDNIYPGLSNNVVSKIRTNLALL